MAALSFSFPASESRGLVRDFDGVNFELLLSLIAMRKVLPIESSE